jgi:hypothetical protein
VSGGSAPPVREGYPVSCSPKMYRPSSSRHLRFDSRSIIPFIIVKQRTPLISASFHMGTMH